MAPSAHRLPAGRARRPDFAIPLNRPLWISSSIARAEGAENIEGYAIAIGWDRPQESSAYLVADEQLPTPVWIGEADVAGHSIRLPE
jgi:hypothetical protein